jgi:hypothetical protein
MGGWGSAIDWIFERLPIQKPEERRRNEIEKLEKRQRFIESNLRNDLVDEYMRNQSRIKQLLNEAKNRN